MTLAKSGGHYDYHNISKLLEDLAITRVRVQPKDFAKQTFPCELPLEQE